MKKTIITRFLFFIIFSLVLSTYPRIGWSSTSGDNLSTHTKNKIHKKSKKKGKKIKPQKLKVAKNGSGPQDEISDQTEVSQQADNSGTKKKK
jgi:hypothetical protein